MGERVAYPLPNSEALWFSTIHSLSDKILSEQLFYDYVIVYGVVLA